MDPKEQAERFNAAVKIMEELKAAGKSGPEWDYSADKNSSVFLLRQPNVEFEQALEEAGHAFRWSGESKNPPYIGNTRIEALLDDATNFIAQQSLNLPSRAAGAQFSGNESPSQIVQQLLNISPGIVVGESHSSVESKRFLIDSMPALASSGVRTLFFEHLPSEIHHDICIAYAKAGAAEEMPPALQQALKKLDHDFLDRELFVRGKPGQSQSGNTFLEVVKAAKRSGINVVPIDCFHSYKSFPGGGMSSKGTVNRVMVMNFLAAKRIEAVKQDPGSGKWAAFVGSAHANTCNGVLGLAELTGGVTIVVDDKTPVDGMRLRTNVKNYNAGKNSTLPEGIPKVDVVFSPSRQSTSSVHV